MKRKRYSAEQIVYALRQVESGSAAVEICRKLGLKHSWSTCRWTTLKPTNEATLVKQSRSGDFLTKKGEEGDWFRVSWASGEGWIHHSIVVGEDGIREAEEKILREVIAKEEVKRDSVQKQRWLAAALLNIEPRLRKVKGFLHLPMLRLALQRELKLGNSQQQAA